MYIHDLSWRRVTTYDTRRHSICKTQCEALYESGRQRAHVRLVVHFLLGCCEFIVVEGSFQPETTASYFL